MKRRVLVVVCALALIISMFSSCSKADDKDTSNADTKNSTEKTDDAESMDNGEVTEPSDAEPGWKGDTSPVTLTWWLDANWYARTWGESTVSQYITEKTGVSIEFVVPSGDPNEALTLMMVGGGELPDILSVGFWETNYKKLQEEGFVYALDDLAEQYDPYFFKAVDPALLNWNRLEDGNVYVLPNEAYTQKGMEETGATNANQTFLVRKDLYEDMGSPDMRTPEGFIAALQLLQDEYSTYKDQEIIPFYAQAASANGCYGLEEFLQNLLAIPYEVDGKIYDRYTDAEYIRWLKAIREAVSKGLITMDFYVDTADQVNEKYNNASYFCMLSEWTAMAAANTFLYNNNPDAVYIAVDGPSNSNLDPAAIFPGSMTGWLPVMISKDCSDPERAIKFLTYWASEEGQKDFFLGEKGVTWDTIDGKDQILPEILEILNTDPDKFENEIGATDTYWMLRDPCMVAQWRPEKIEPIAQNQEWANAHADYSGGMYKLLTPEADSEEGIINAQITSAWGQTLPMLINAQTEEEFDALWNDFIEQRESLGFDKLEAFRQMKLEEFKVKLQ